MFSSIIFPLQFGVSLLHELCNLIRPQAITSHHHKSDCSVHLAANEQTAASFSFTLVPVLLTSAEYLNFSL